VVQLGRAHRRRGRRAHRHWRVRAQPPQDCAGRPDACRAARDKRDPGRDYQRSGGTGGAVHPGSRRSGISARRGPPRRARGAREDHARRIRGEDGGGPGGHPADRPARGGPGLLARGRLKGYRDKHPELQYALYDPDRGGSLLVGTGTTVALNVEDSDSQTLVVPIWVGYPSSKHFQARFRLLDGGAVRQIAATETLPTSNHRYACPSDT
jgi:hypothetical protein